MDPVDHFNTQAKEGIPTALTLKENVNYSANRITNNSANNSTNAHSPMPDCDRQKTDSTSNT
jgi:hypothetical protein